MADRYRARTGRGFALPAAGRAAAGSVVGEEAAGAG